MNTNDYSITSLEFSNSCKLECINYAYNGYVPNVTLEYIEHSQDSYYSDSITSIDISREEAIEIIKFLQQSFKIRSE